MTFANGSLNVLHRFSPLVILFVALLPACGCSSAKRTHAPTSRAEVVPEYPIYKALPANAPPQLKQLVDAAVAQAGVTKGYDPSYVKLDYPGGDVSAETGVCSDVVIRAFRKIGVDLQKDVHEDMLRAFSQYPQNWGLSNPDTNIDHRRVPNLMVYFTRQGKAVEITSNPEDYLPGDIVTWKVSGDSDHIGMITDMWSESGKRCLVVHNIGSGTRVEDVLFNWNISGHYRYFPINR